MGSGIKTNPIFVYQMGSVGSMSMTESLRKAYAAHGLEVPIYHFHYLENFKTLAERGKRDLLDPSKFLESLVFHKRNRETVLNLPAEKFNIVSLVRDPIARNVSTFFSALDEFIPDWEQRHKEGKIDADELHKVFLTKDSYIMTALNWFDEQVTPVFGLDVFATPFPTDLAYKTYSSAKADFLVMRLEDLNDHVNHALHEFLGIDNFRMSKINTGESKKTGELYRLFMTKPLPEEYVDRMYDTKLARHFYTSDELDAFKRRWTGLVETHISHQPDDLRGCRHFQPSGKDAASMEDFFSRCEDPWRLKDIARHGPRIEIFRAVLQQHGSRFRRLLDIGCAEGFVTDHLHDLADFTLGIDVSPTAIQRAVRDYGHTCSFKVAGIGDFRSDEPFDTIVITGVLYYCPSDSRQLINDNISLHLASGGLLLISHIKESSGTTGFVDFFDPERFQLVTSKEFPCDEYIQSLHLYRKR